MRHQPAPPNVKRFAITVPWAELPGTRVLAFANQGRNHHDTREQAEQYLRDVQQNNSPERLKEFKLDLARVDEIECYHHGDAVGIYVDE